MRGASAIQPTPRSVTPFVSRIAGTGAAFPARVMTNDDLARQIETNDAWIRERTGIRERRVSEPGNPSDHNSSLGLRAAQQALEMAGLRAEAIDTILYATFSPDTLLPSTACWLQHKLGANRAWAMDVNAACSGFVYALHSVDQMIRSGASQVALVVGADVTTAFLDWRDRSSCILFGDGAGAAVVVRATPDANAPQILASRMQSDGSLWELFHIPAGGANLPVTPERSALGLDKMQMKGPEIFKIAVRTLAEFAESVCAEAGVRLADVDWIVPHQANLRIIEAVARRLDYPMERVIINLDRFGNTSAGTVPTALDEAVRDGRIRPGQLVLLDVFGAGLTYGSTLLRWG